jgi:ribosomal-protein-alanine N-acetyltransferase
VAVNDSIRPLDRGDLPACRRLQQHLPEPSPRLLDPPVVVDGHVSVAAGDTVGYVLTVGQAERHVAELVVAPSARRNGHASALLATLVSTYPATSLTLTVAAENTAARSLYDQFGFQVVRRLPGFFAEDEGLLLARRPRAE